MRKGMTRWFTLLLAVLLAAGLVSAGALAEAVLPGEPVWGANPEYDLWTVVMRNEMGTTIPVTVCADKELTRFEVLFTLGDDHKMTGMKDDNGVQVNYSRIPGLEPIAAPMIEDALAQNIWLPTSECPLEYIDPAAHDNEPLFVRAGVWDSDFVRKNESLNGLPCLIHDEKIEAYKSNPVEEEKKGSVELLPYTTGGADAFAYVYLPAQYDASQQYSVLYLLHGGGGNAASWFTCTYDDVAGFKDGDDITGALGTAVNVLDNIFANGDAAPCIIVTPNGDTNGAGFFGFGPVLRDLITKVDETYPTIADRDHRALAGLSMGSIATWHGGIADNLENVSWFANMSGGPAAGPEAETYIKESIIPALEKAAAAGYPIHMMMNFNGLFDMALPPHVAAHKLLVEFSEQSDILEVGENYDFLVSDGTHAWDAWQLYLYDFLTIIFK